MKRVEHLEKVQRQHEISCGNSQNMPNSYIMERKQTMECNTNSDPFEFSDDESRLFRVRKPETKNLFKDSGLRSSVCNNIEASRNYF
jgi:hypothetical protein